MNEDTKDRIEDAESAVVEAIISAIPIFGGPGAVAWNRATGSAVQRRHAKLLDELSTDLRRFQEQFPDEVSTAILESDEVQAALERLTRRLKESGSAEKRQILRNALLNTLHGFEEPDRFEDALEAVTVDDVRVLEIVSYWSPMNMLNLVSAVKRKCAERGIAEPTRIGDRVRKLQRLGLMIERQQSELKESQRRQPTGRSATVQHVETVPQAGVSDAGKDFLEFVKSPLDEEAGVAPSP